MSINDVSKWHKRMSVVYAFGVWSMIASYAFFKYTGRYDDAPGESHTLFLFLFVLIPDIKITTSNNVT